METENHINQTKDTVNNYMVYINLERVKYAQRHFCTRVKNLKDKLIKKQKKRYRPRVRVRGNSDSN